MSIFHVGIEMKASDQIRGSGEAVGGGAPKISERLKVVGNGAGSGIRSGLAPALSGQCESYLPRGLEHIVRASIYQHKLSYYAQGFGRQFAIARAD